MERMGRGPAVLANLEWHVLGNGVILVQTLAIKKRGGKPISLTSVTTGLHLQMVKPVGSGAPASAPSSSKASGK